MNEEDCKVAPISWRIYRLPGDREWWRIDHGQNSVVLFAKHLRIAGSVQTVDRPNMNPRAWLEVSGVLLLNDDIAEIFGAVQVTLP